MKTDDAGAARIGLVLHDFAGGGSERVAVRHANRWASVGRKVHIFCGTESGPTRALLSDHIPVIAADPIVMRGWRSRILLGRALCEMLARNPVDVLVGPSNFHLPIMAVAGRMMAEERPAFVCKLSNPLTRPDRHPARQHLFHRKIRRRTAQVDMLVAMSGSLLDDARTCLQSHHVTVIREPLDDVPRAGPRRVRNPYAKEIICAGRQVAQKHFSLALETLAALDDLHVHMTFLGDGPERRSLERLARRLAIADRVTFTGHVHNITPWLVDADLLLSTSRYEGYPAVLGEAIVARLPVVATRSSPAIDESLVHPSFGETTDATPDALAAAIRRVIGNGPIDEPARRVFLLRHDSMEAASAWLALLDRTVALRRAQCAMA